MMRQARVRADSRALFVESDAFRLPFADKVFTLVISTRFLHLLPPGEQKAVLAEMLRVMKPGGRLLVDFDNFSSRWLFCIPYFLYNMLRYHRAAPYAVYNRIASTRQMLEHLGVQEISICGVGGPYLVLFHYFSPSLAFRVGLLHRFPPLRFMAEQFIVSGLKR
jgi:ubiquinone/menaquinone biosynthesis C-methylase UbiE